MSIYSGKRIMETTIIPVTKAYRISRLLHWLCAISFSILVVTMPIMLDSANNSSERAKFYMLHQSIASVFAMLLVLRFIWMYVSKHNGVQTTFDSKWQFYAAKANHFILYFIMITMPISGLVSRITHGKELLIFNLKILPEMSSLVSKDIHYYAAEFHLVLLDLFYILIAFHVLGAIMHLISRLAKNKQTYS